MIYNTWTDYISQIETIEGKIARIDVIIDKLEDAELRLAEKGEIATYAVDSGQSKINVSYRTAGQIETAITALERRKNRYIQKITGRKTKLVYIK